MDLKQGDVFAHEIKLNNREAFIVKETGDKHIICFSRNDDRSDDNKQPIKKLIKGESVMVWLLNDKK